MWSSPAVAGEGPPPCVDFTLTVINRTTAAMFGGQQPQLAGWVADLYLLDFVKWHWSALPAAGPPKSWPSGRVYHTAFPFITSELNQHCFLTIACGWDGSRNSNDLWVMNITEHNWKKVSLPEAITPRHGHAAGVIYGEGAQVRLVLHGGVQGLDFYHPLAATTVIELENKALGWEAKTVTDYQTLRLEALYRQSLSHGFIESSTTICLFSGAAGAGKTHVKRLVSNRPPPSVRHSTPLAETPIRAFSCSRFDRTDNEWHEVDDNEQVEILGARMAHGMPLNEAESLSLQLSTSLQQVSEVPLAGDAPSSHEPPSNTSPLIYHSSPTVHSTSSSASISLPGPPQSSCPPDKAYPVKQQSHTELVCLIEKNPQPKKYCSSLALGSLPAPPQSSISPGEVHPLEQQSYTELVRLIGKNPQPKKYHDIDWVLMFDTGGQPAFHEIISLFFPEIAIILFVTNLSERLDQHPDIKYFSQGRQIGHSYPSRLTNLELFQHSFRAIQSQASTQEDEAAIPKMIVVGTHRDREWRCSESRREKNRKLMALLSQEGMKHTIFYSPENEEIVHPVNAKKPKRVDQQVACIIRKEVFNESASKKQKKTPIKWHVLEQSLRKLARSKKRGILSWQECLQEAHRLHLSEEVLEATLEHLTRLSTLLYYRDILPQVIFIEPQPLLDKITELIERSHGLRGTISLHGRARSGTWLEFRDRGIITLQHLEGFTKHYIPGLFTPSDLLQLLEHKLIIASISEDRYFMPSLLPELKVEEASKHRIEPFHSLAAPLAITFPDGLAPRGLYCSMIASLLSPATPPFLELFPSSKPHHPQCVSRNYIKFTLPNNCPGSLTLVDAYTHFEVHMDVPLNVPFNTAHWLCSTVKKKILSSLKTAATTLHYHRLSPQVAFLCEFTAQHAHIEVTPDLAWWQRLFSIQPRTKMVTPPPHVATTDGTELWRCKLAPDIAYGELAKRHLIWLEAGTCQNPPTEETVHRRSVSRTTEATLTKELLAHTPSPQPPPLDMPDQSKTSKTAIPVTSTVSTASAGPALDHSTVTEYLLDLDKSQVYNLGISLGLSVGRVKSKFESAHDTTMFLDDIISAWLQQVDQVDKKGGPSWKTLVAALRSNRLKLTGIASSIANVNNLS